MAGDIVESGARTASIASPSLPTCVGSDARFISESGSSWNTGGRCMLKVAVTDFRVDESPVHQRSNGRSSHMTGAHGRADDPLDRASNSESDGKSTFFFFFWTLLPT